GTVGIRLPTERSTCREADSSRAIWHPELPAPTTRTSPRGRRSGRWYHALWICVTSGSSDSPIDGTNGVWNGPVATTTCFASNTCCDAFATYTPLLLESEVTVVSGSIGSSNCAA